MLPGIVVVQRGVPSGAGLELVEEVEHDFSQWKLVANFDALRRQVLHPFEGSAPLLTQLHDRADEV